MKKKLQLTGENIAAAALILAYFLPWISVSISSFSGFSLTSTAVSPGLLGGYIDGLIRLLMLLLLVVPAGGIFVLWQNYMPDTKYNKYQNPAHILPFAALAAALIISYIKINNSMHQSVGALGFDTSDLSSFGVKPPSIFDMLGFGFYLSLFAGLYLLLINRKFVKDKNFSPKETPIVSEHSTDLN